MRKHVQRKKTRNMTLWPSCIGIQGLNWTSQEKREATIHLGFKETELVQHMPQICCHTSSYVTSFPPQHTNLFQEHESVTPVVYTLACVSFCLLSPR